MRKFILILCILIFGIFVFIKLYGINEQTIYVDKIDKESEENINLMKAYELNEEGKFEEALSFLDKALIEENNNLTKGIIYGEKAFALNSLGRYNEALLALDKAIQNNPNNALYYSDKGACLSNLGRVKEAIISYEKGLEKARNLKNKKFILENLLILYEGLGNMNKVNEIQKKIEVLSK